MFSILVMTALAAPNLLPSGSSTIYGGLGMSNWRWGMSGNRRDPAAILRVDTWAGHGLGQHVMLSGGLPFAHGRILLDRPGTAPCPNGEVDYCTPVTAPGTGHVLLHLGSARGLATGRVALGIQGDPWNASTRTRYVNIGQGVFGGLAELSGGLSSQGFGGFLEGRYLQRFGRTTPGVDFRSPSDAVQLQLAAQGGRGPLSLVVSANHHRQLQGVDYGPAYLREQYRSEQRWGAVAFRQWRAEAKLSLALTDTSGLHLAASRAFHTRNGPRDLSDLSLGIHLWIPKK